MSRRDNAADDKAEIRADLRLRFSRTYPYFGKGTMMLLKEIQECGSVRRACEECGFSYSKGWTIIKRCENGLGYKIVERQKGGSGGGIAVVNETGEKLMKIFEELEKELSEYADNRFAELMKENGL